jgi:hypothetical protein
MEHSSESLWSCTGSPGRMGGYRLGPSAFWVCKQPPRSGDKVENIRMGPGAWEFVENVGQG